MTLTGVEQSSKERTVFLGAIVWPDLHLVTSIHGEDSVVAFSAATVELSKQLKSLCEPPRSV